MQPTRSLYLLGPMRVEQGKQACAVKYTKARGLLAYLALQPGYHTRGALADLFWPDEDGQGGRDKLKRMLFHLRDTLGDELFESDRQVVRLRPETGLWIDAHVFASMIEQASRTLDTVTGLDLAAHLQHLADAVALYQGPFLHGLSVRDTPDLEQWIELQRDEYQRRRVFGERLLADGYARLGDLDQALAHARQLVALAPFDESGWHCLLALLLRAGRRDDAETEYRRLCDILHEELGESPGQALRQLLETPPARMEQRAAGPERRQLTVVAIELAPNGIDDPDQLAGMMRPPLVQCETILRQSWGYTVRTPTGGLLGYFGYPTALEGAGRHAVEAAMRCVQASTARVGIGVGVHTGLVISSVADDSPDTGGRVSRAAAQLADMALPGEVLICDATQRLIGVAIATTPHGSVRERHANREIAVHRVNPDPTPERRSRRRAAMLFGRDGALAELAAAHAAVRDESTGLGVLALVIGEAGIGKSALVRHFVQTRGLRAIDLACAQDGAGTPFHPIARWVRAQSAADASQMPQPALLAHRRLRELFDMHAEGNVPHAWKQVVLDEAPRLLATLLPDGGVLMLDDAHWADPSTQELLALMAENPPGGRLLLICARPEFELPWRHTVGLRRIDLAPLDAGAAASIVRAATPRVALPAALRERIVHLAEGVPLFLQELARATAAQQGGRGTGGAMPMPASLQELMMARIDAAGSAKPVAHFASCLGPEFQADVLARASGRSMALVERALDTLVACALVQRQDNGRYVFRHALLHKAAYDAQPQERRQDAHRRIAIAMREHDETAVQTEPEVLAWHFRQADEPDAAIEHYRLAGEYATGRQAFREACAHYQSALDVLRQTGTIAQTAQRELQLRMALGVPLVALHGYGSEPARHNFETALALAQPMGDDVALFPVYWGLWLGSSSWSDFERSIELARKLIHIAEQANAAPLLAHAYYALGNSLCCHGDFAGAVTALETGLSHYRPESADTGLGEDARITGLSFLSWAYWFTGRHDASLAASEQALAMGREQGRRHSFSFALVFAAMLRRLRREVAPAEALASEATEVATETGVALWALAGQTIRGWALASRGDVSGLERITDSVGRLSEIMGGVEGIFFGLLVEACAGTGDIALGLHAAERGAHVAARRSDAHWQAEFLRHKGDFLRAGHHPDDTVRPWLQQALQTARAQGSPMLALRAALSLLRLEGNDPALDAECVAVLRGALDALQGGETLADVQEARARLADVAARAPQTQAARYGS
ncbi:AAA family ATPase [Pandoraea nosoerga]|uniref:BTAD domain-containing putative transcriptional regulator n=1 Tax=Pandoraea nosoerga TaxID=2508296 RepID=UPI00197D5C3D|nr:BTAD domain-containing putative transcriptional regulator [Pandoraea nosoerga]MBN4667093.1 AAA family ATPase [Pandoraea nosoerga]MBN4677082.1 AAA family ATPase [Pandoraea nosoerga]MBN4681882.1 AAA family ATPase [Pandoraea nosoerga]MBN4746198.1 AAA family ATPase [Pandoraea nosoerga]